MPKKSVKEMSNIERRRYSLSHRIFRATIIGAVLLGLVALFIGFGLYSYALIGRYVSDAYNLTRSTENIMGRVVDVKPISRTVMEIYHSLSESERAETGTKAYRERFVSVVENPDYRTAIGILSTFRSSSDMNDLYIGMYDAETQALVYIADPEIREPYICMPGDWETVEAREVDRFLKQPGGGKIFDISKTEKYGWMCTAGVPVVDKEGETVCFVLADITLDDVDQGMKNFLFQFFLAMIIMVTVYTFLLMRHLRRTLVNPINDIARAAQDYVRAKQDGKQTTDFFSMLNIRTGDEVENLSLVMADMERDLSEYVENMTTITAEKERARTELDLARRIQSSVLPNIFPPWPDRTDFNIFASMVPAKEVGGDFYDFFMLDDTHLGLVIADVSGKGVPAALVMMITKIMIKNYALTGDSPGEVLKRVNEQICRNNPEEMFITVWFGVLDLCSGELTAVNAGHEYPALCKPDASFEILKDAHSFIIGGLETSKYKEYTVRLEPGEKIFLYTDGIPEAANERNELFGTERMLKALNDAKDEEPDAILRRVARSVEYFVGGAPQFDDMTMLCLEYIGPQL